MNHSLILVEGPQDQAFIGKCLEVLGYKKFEKELSVFHGRIDLECWKELIKRPDPSQDIKSEKKYYDHVYKTAFYTSDNSSIAIYPARGSRLKSKKITGIPFYLRSLINNDDLPKLDSLAIIGDADSKPPDKTVQEFTDSFGEFGFALPKHAGEFAQKEYKVGVYVFPNNNCRGILEYILIECGRKRYPELISQAEEFTQTLRNQGIKHKSLRGYRKLKTHVALTASVLRPGDNNEMTLIHDEWVSDATKDIESVKQFLDFLTTLLEVPTP